MIQWLWLHWVFVFFDYLLSIRVCVPFPYKHLTVTWAFSVWGKFLSFNISPLRPHSGMMVSSMILGEVLLGHFLFFRIPH